MEDKIVNEQLPLIKEAPWFLCTHGSSKHKHTQTIYSLVNAESYLISIPQLRGKSILASCRGWLILRDRDQHTIFSIFNPFTSQAINLPPLLAAPYNRREVKCALKSTPDYDDCVLLLCFNDAGLMFSCQPTQPHSSWVQGTLDLEGSSLQVFDFFTLNGVMYFSVRCSNIKKSFYEVDVNTNSLTFRPLQIPEPDLICPRLGGFEEYLVESCDSVYRIFIADTCVIDMEFIDVKVFKLDLDGRIWREIKSLDGRAFFLGSNCCTWCWGATNEPESQRGIQGDCIYFLLHNTVEPMYSYNLYDRSFMVFRPFPNLLGPIDCGAWVISEHQRLFSVNELKDEIKKNNVCHQGVGPMASQDVELSQNNVRHESRFGELPLHLIELISKHMHLFEYWNFRASCKMFRSVCPPRQCRANKGLPLFMFFTNDGGSCELIDPCRQDLCSSILHLFPEPFTVQFSKNGWLLTLVDHKSVQYFNLDTGVRGEFTPFMNKMQFRSIAFSTDPTCSVCLIVGIVGTVNNSVLIYYLVSGIKIWKCFRLEGIQFCAGTSSPVFLGGAFYFLDARGLLGIFRLEDGEPRWCSYDKPETVKEFFSFNLVECAGEVYSVFMEKMGKWVQVFRFDDSIKDWIEVESLENHCFFISRASSFSIVAKDHKMRNRIYLPRFCRKGMVYYSLDTRNYHVLGSDDIKEDVYGTNKPSSCCWM